MSPNPSDPAAPHRWTFFRRGGLDQAALSTVADLAALDQLDLKLWVALACPVRGLELDEKTLALIDADADGRIRPSELIAAVQWALARLKRPEELLQPSEILSLDSIQDGTPEGQALLSAARQVLGEAAEAKARTIGLDDLGEPEKLFPPGRINGDGVVPPEAAADGATRQLIEDIVSCRGASQGRTGTTGVSSDQVEAFFTDLEAYAAWGESDAAKGAAFLGDRTDAAYGALAAVRSKVDDYFTRCRFAAFDHRAQPALNRPEEDFLAVAAKTLDPSTPELASFPLAHVAPGRPLPLASGVNPAWADALGRFRTDAVAPVLGPDKVELTEAEWSDLQARFGAYADSLKTRPPGKIQSLGLSRAREILGGSGRAGLLSLLADDARKAPAFEAFADLERLIRYRRDLFAVLRNFVNFEDFYSPDRWSTFQAGVLYLDGRSCELCVRVDDPAAHSALAALSSACIAYLDCRRAGQSLKIAACFTQGDSDYLFTGRNGIFYDRKGQDWDATVVKLIDNPISLRQAVFSPYKKFIIFVQRQVAKRASAAEAATGSTLASLATPAPGPAGASPTGRFDVGTIAALGVAVGGLSSAIGVTLGAFFGLKAWMPVGLLGILVVISGPSVLIAWIKLRQRALGPILEASGWAINGRVQLTIPLGRALTDRARLPSASRRHFKDPYGERSSAWVWLFLLALLALAAGVLYGAHRTGLWPFAPPPHSAPAGK